MFRFILLLLSISIPFNFLVNSGPMVGYSTKSEVALWIQTKKSSKVKFIYWDVNESFNIFETEEIITNKNSGFTATLIADLVKPGTTYHYQLIIDNQKIEFDYELEFQTQEHWEYRNPAPDFSFAIGSCAYTNEKDKDRPGKSYGGDYFIYSLL